MNSIEIKIYNQSHSLVNTQVVTADPKEIPALIKLITRSAAKRNQYVQTCMVK